MHSPAEPRTAVNLALLAALFVVGIASLAGLYGGRGPAALVLVGAFLLGAVSALWSSLHEAASDDLSSDADRPALERLASDDALEAVLRALLDLDHEVSVGKILPDDERVLRQELRAEAKRLLKVQDARIDPQVRARAADLVEKALAQGASRSAPETKEIACPSCSTAHAPEDAFCKRCGTKLAAEVAS